MPPSEVGEAYLAIRASMAGFLDDARRQIQPAMRELGAMAQVPIDAHLDNDVATAEMRETVARMRATGQVPITATLEDEGAMAEMRRDLSTMRAEANVPITANTHQFEGGVGRVRGMLSQTAMLAGSIGIGYAAFRGLSFGYDAIIGFNSKLQQTHTAFQTILGSSSLATQAIKQLNTFAAQTPFEFQDIIPVAQQLLGTGTKLADLTPILTNLGNAVSATGGSADQLRLLTLAYTQLATSGTAHLQDLMQVNNAVPGSMARIAAAMHMTIGQFRDEVSKGAITSEEATTAINKGFEKAFGGGMVAQSHTFAGAMSTIHDVLQLTLATAFRPFFNIIARGADQLSTFLQGGQVRQWGREFTQQINGALGAVGDFLGGIRRIAQAPSLAVGIHLAIQDAGDLVRGLMEGIQHAISGTSGRKIEVPSGMIQLGGREGMGEQIFDSLRAQNWGMIGGAIAEGISRGVKGTIDIGAQIVASLGTSLNAHKGEIASFGLEIVLTMLVDLFDPTWWLAHWRLALLVAVTALGLATGGLGEAITKALPFTRFIIAPLMKLGELIKVPLRIFGDGLLTGLRSVFPDVERVVTSGGRGIVTKLLWPIRQLPMLVGEYVDAMGIRAGQMLGLIARDALDWGGRIVRFLMRPLNTLDDLIGNLLSRVLVIMENRFGGWLSAAGSFARRIWHVIVDTLSPLVDRIAGIWGSIRDGIGRVWGGIVSTLEGWVNKLLSPVNSILGFLHLPKIPTFGDGGVVGDAGRAGRDVHRLAAGGVVPGPNVKRDVVPALLTPGEIVLNERQQARLGGHRFLANLFGFRPHGGHFAGGGIAGGGSGPSPTGGNVVGDVFGAVGGALSALMDPIGWLKSHLPSLPSMAGVAGDILGALATYIKDKVVSWVEDHIPFGGGGPAGTAATGANQRLGLQMMLAAGWPASQWGALQSLWNRESGWNQFARNPSSGAYGIPQSLPAEKMASAGGDWLTNPATQIRWGLGYIRGRYGSPAAAWAHETQVGWYHGGGVVPGSPTENVPAMLRGQEVIFTPEQMAALSRRQVQIGTLQIVEARSPQATADAVLGAIAERASG